MEKRALLIGIDDYEHLNGLRSAGADAQAMARILATNEDGSPNYHCRTFTRRSSSEPRITRAYLHDLWQDLFASFEDQVLFYFAGHGAVSDLGGYLCTYDATIHDPGLPMNDLVTLANRSRAQEVVIILDCCHAGAMADSPYRDDMLVPLRRGVTLIAAARPAQKSLETIDGGVFTQLVIDALDGGSADVRGRVTAPSIYAYADQMLRAWDQRPLFKSYASRLSPLRTCKALVPDDLLRELPALFSTADRPLPLDPSFDPESDPSDPAKVAVFQKLKTLRNAGMLNTTDGRDLYFAMKDRGHVALTAHGRSFWKMAKANRIR